MNHQYCIKKNLDFSNKFINYDTDLKKQDDEESNSKQDTNIQDKENKSVSTKNRRKAGLNVKSEFKRIPTFFKAK